MRYLLILLILAPLASAAPILHSLPGASHSIFLDFDGRWTNSWEPTPRPAYEHPELIPQVFAYVASAFAPFDVDVTTDYDGREQARALVGGNNPAGTGSTGDANQGLYTYPPLATCWVYSELMPDPRDVADIIAHELGHVYGLWHQSLYADGVKIAEYAPGVIMGNPLGYSDARWTAGLNSNGVWQDDAVVLGHTLGLVSLAVVGLAFLLIIRRTRCQSQGEAL